MSESDSNVDLLVKDADCLVTMDGQELDSAWLAVKDGLVHSLGSSGDKPPAAARTVSAAGGLITPGFICTHHHIYQNLTRD